LRLSLERERGERDRASEEKRMKNREATLISNEKQKRRGED